MSDFCLSRRAETGHERLIQLVFYCPRLCIVYSIVGLDRLMNSRFQFGNAGEDTRYSARLSSCANQPSTASSHEALVGVKCGLKRGCFCNHCLMTGVLCVVLLSRITCKSSAAGVARSICRRKARKFLARWRWVIRPTTWPVRMSKTAYRLAVPWRL